MFGWEKKVRREKEREKRERGEKYSGFFVLFGAREKKKEISLFVWLSSKGERIKIPLLFLTLYFASILACIIMLDF